ncbi:UDP-N-acetylmuramoyl-L-alanyl-D-glutamate--2,6-diaminopimelate ligase [bacterium]|nr:MAG: UDP-N-acetylmuramoyl-L-alanyl-D-glutamate--2,6-diaminopimelate ligase [bacterium]
MHRAREGEEALKRLSQLTDGLAARVSGEADVASITLDTRKAGPGALFFAYPGMTRDSHTFLPAARAAGATAAVVHSPEGYEAALALGLAAVLPDDYNDAAWRLAHRFHDEPTRRMVVVGVTGTNGKTTTAWLVRDMLAALGVRAGYLGTLGFQLPGEDRELANTTPFAVDLANLFAEARDRGVEALAMEVSSHALEQRRVDGVQFDAGVFTNLTQDHLDFHGTMEAYGAAKRRLFTDFRQKEFVAALNQDDPVGRAWAQRLDVPTIGYSLDPARLEGLPTAMLVSPKHVGLDRIKMEATVTALDGISSRPVSDRSLLTAGLGGGYNVENLSSAAAAMLAIGRSMVEVRDAMRKVRPVPGRFEAVPNERGIGIIVDYAHTPDALEKLLDAVRPLTTGRVITVFGCGGDRDRTKRPKMARAASERSDVSVVTSDNPRTEDPDAIVAEVAAGIVPGRESLTVVDRREAVAAAIGMAKPGDAVVIAGKGHEDYQIIGREKIHMDDRELAREALAQ